MKRFNKTALATAFATMAAVSVAPAYAATLDFTGDGETIVLADVIFGVNEGSGSEETLITAPEVTLDLDGGGDDGTTTSVATVKFTLGGGAVFGEDLSTTTLVDSSNGGVGAFSLSGTFAGAAASYEVVQGGAIEDNTITFELTFATDGDIISDLTFTGYAVKNLTSALNPDSSDKVVELGVEYVESDDFGGADGVVSTATDDPIVIFGSQAPVDLTASAVDFFATPFTRINVGSGETTFTDIDDDFTTETAGQDGRSDFDEDGDTTIISLGTLQLNLEDADTDDFPDASGKVRKKKKKKKKN